MMQLAVLFLAGAVFVAAHLAVAYLADRRPE